MADTSGRSVRLNVQQIKVLRTKKAWNQQQLADKAGVEKRTIENAETGKPVSLTTANGIAKALNVDLESLMESGPVPPTPTPVVPPVPDAIPNRKVAPSRILRHSPAKLFGRESELAALDAAWADPVCNVYTLVAWGGAGKTSLVAHWVSERVAARQWLGVERYFDWSFYSQGTGESRQSSSDLFIHDALVFFGDPEPNAGGPWERGERLAGYIRQHRTLLVLDGLEPLQYPPNDPQAGRLKDPGLESLLHSLAADNPGLVIVTTREHLTNIDNQATTREAKLDKLSKEAAVALLRHLQIVGTDEEIHTAWRDSGGHALTLQLLGSYIADAFEDRDIRHYHEVKFEAADLERQGRSAFKVMIAYERWLASAGPERQRELAILRLTGLFDRPMSRECLAALRAEPAIPGLTDKLVVLKESQWTTALNRLRGIDLLMITAEAIDAHPLIREYFAKQLRDTQLEAFQEAHSRLFDHLCNNTTYQPDTLEGLQPLYQAVIHGCKAGRHDNSIFVYNIRIQRNTTMGIFYSTFALGAIGTNVAACSEFFTSTWDCISPLLSQSHHSWLFNEAAINLLFQGRIHESIQPMKYSLAHSQMNNKWAGAAKNASSLSDAHLLLGDIDTALDMARLSVLHAKKSIESGLHTYCLINVARVFQFRGNHVEAGKLFSNAERDFQRAKPKINYLFGLAGHLYCEYLFKEVERCIWNIIININKPQIVRVLKRNNDIRQFRKKIKQRVAYSMSQNLAQHSLLDPALDYLTLAQLDLFWSILNCQMPVLGLNTSNSSLAVQGLRNSGHITHLPRGLLVASLNGFTRGENSEAMRYLDEAQQIAERVPMPLYLADVHLHRARMFRDRTELAKARTLIEKHGYGRRRDELADAEAAASDW